MKWWPKRKKTVDEIIAESFFEEGRWVTEDERSYTDKVTGAVLVRDMKGSIYINNVRQPYDVMEAFYHVLRQPGLQKESEQKLALRKLYERE